MVIRLYDYFWNEYLQLGIYPFTSKISSVKFSLLFAKQYYDVNLENLILDRLIIPFWYFSLVQSLSCLILQLILLEEILSCSYSNILFL